MRTDEEIRHAIARLKDAESAPLAQNNPGLLRSVVGMIGALEWVMGSDQRGGFGEMIRMLDCVDRAMAAARKASEENE